MTYLSPYERRRRRSVRFRALLIVLAGFVLVSLLDFPLLHLFYFDKARAIEHHDWYRLLRVTGFMGAWVLIGALFILHDRSRHRGLALILAPAAAGLMAELLKLVIARERPVEDGVIQPGFYHFRGLFAGFSDGSNLGLPSSHAAVAFGGCLMLTALVPHTRRLLIALATGCAITRMLTGAHFASDVYLGAILGWIAAMWLTRAASAHVPQLRPGFTLVR